MRLWGCRPTLKTTFRCHKTTRNSNVAPPHSFLSLSSHVGCFPAVTERERERERGTPLPFRYRHPRRNGATTESRES